MKEESGFPGFLAEIGFQFLQIEVVQPLAHYESSRPGIDVQKQFAAGVPHHLLGDGEGNRRIRGCSQSCKAVPKKIRKDSSLVTSFIPFDISSSRGGVESLLEG